ncbi:MAG: hypothetical protein FWD78_06610 [Treponema sp.]|nr:hypothetical protein [Treponema sp.]
MKKFIICALILSLAGGVLFAQETADDQRPGNNISIYGTMVGLALNYEMCFNSHLSLLADTSFNVIPITFTAAIKGRVYPFGRAFYLEIGAGFGITPGYLAGLADVLTLGLTKIKDKYWLRGLVLTPSLGWKLNLGKSGLTLPINLGIDFFAGFRDVLPVDFVPNIRIGVGYSF